uniref:Uncharacterized protein n=1 Tax=Anguilla anguilla TaxID=7936 RepID=A0A0E9RNL6_ANGAN
MFSRDQFRVCVTSMSFKMRSPLFSHKCCLCNCICRRVQALIISAELPSAA